MSCYSCMKFVYIFLNFIFLLLGIVGLGIVIWILVDPTIPLHFTQEPNDFMIATIIYLLVAVLLILISILGIYSALKEIRWVLILSFSLLLIIIVVEVASGVWICVNRKNLDDFTHTSVKHTVQDGYDNNSNIKDIYDVIQTKMHCCGADLATDWVRNNKINMGISAKATKYNIPTSCCKETASEQACLDATQDIKIGNDLDYNIVNQKGCYISIKEYILNSLIIIFSVFGTILGIKVIGFFLGIILAFSMTRNNRYKG